MYPQQVFSRRSFLMRSAGAFAIAAIASMPIARHVAGQAGDYELVCQYNGVRVRNAPGLGGAIIGTVNAGGVVSITGAFTHADGYDWMPVFVHSSKLSGYVASDFFALPDGSLGWFRGTPVHVTSDGVNFRSGPGTGYTVITAYNAGTNGIIQDGPQSANGYTWYNLDIEGRNGWMAADFLAEGQGSGTPAPNPETGQFAIGNYVRPTDPLNLRSAPGTSSSVIGVYGPSSTATVIGGPQTVGMYAWYQVEMWDDGAVGWFANPYLQLARFEPTGARHQVTDGPLNLRSGAGLGYSVITTIPTGGTFVIQDASFGSADGYTWAWVKIEAQNPLTGWVALGFSVEI